MKAALAILINLLFVSVAFAQQPVLLSGNPPSGQLGVWQSKGVLGGAGGSTSPNPNKAITDLPIVNTGEPLCIYDAKITSPSGYHKLCFGANVNNTGGLLDYSANGGAALLDFNIRINGITQSLITDQTLSSHLDTVFGSSRGLIITRGASGWVSLAPGAAGTCLTSNGVGADLSYQACGSSPVTSNCVLVSGTTTNCLLVSGTTTNALLVK